MLMLQKFRSCSAQVEKDRERIENSLRSWGGFVTSGFVAETSLARGRISTSYAGQIKNLLSLLGNNYHSAELSQQSARGNAERNDRRLLP